MALSPGTWLNHYEVLGHLGTGGMGEVYRARDNKLQREVALKVLPKAFAQDPERVARFRREAQVLVPAVRQLGPGMLRTAAINGAPCALPQWMSSKVCGRDALRRRSFRNLVLLRSPSHLAALCPLYERRSSVVLLSLKSESSDFQ